MTSVARPTSLNVPTPTPPKAHRLWGGRFARPSAAALEALNRSIGVDFRLWPYEIRLSQAWAIALCEAGVLTLDESREIEQGLNGVATRLADGITPEAGDEDIHTMIDRLLHEEVGDLASKLHTGRSRNDQVATSTRMWAMDACDRLDDTANALQRALVDQATSLGEAVMPAYTHVQQAQPVLAAHWVLSHFWPLQRDRDRLEIASRSAGVLPLGSGAVAGCAFPISRVLLQGTLGFSSVSPNSMDAVSDRDFVADLLYAVTMLGVHISRLAEDLIFFGSSEFRFLRFGEAFTTGSSMMPQKRNPDALELARGSAAVALGQLTTLLATLKGLPTGYNKDLQGDKQSLFQAVDTMLLVLPAVAGAVAELTFDTNRMREALSSSTMATDIADYLVTRGVAFRDAHRAVGELVREAEQTGVDLTTLPFRAYQVAHPSFDRDVFTWIGAGHSVRRREVHGGTGPAAVEAQLAAARELVASA
jgi:argininosuccinate lyase